MTAVGPRIFLIGYRGTGKTTVARLLADHLKWNWIDADEVLETREGRSIREIFAAEGETYFRNREAALLEEYRQYPNHVIATGGGVALRAKNRETLRALGWVVWLTADPTTIWQRVQGDPVTAARRPALTTLGGRAEVEALLQVREPLYRACAHVTVATADRAPKEIVEEIRALWTVAASPGPPAPDPCSC